MGLLSAYLYNVEANRNAKLAFALNQREEQEAQARAQQAQENQQWRALASGDFQDYMSRSWDDKSSGGTWTPPLQSMEFSSRPPIAPEPPDIPGLRPRAMQRQAAQQPQAGAALGKMLERMKGTASRIARGGRLLDNATRPDSRVQ